MAAHSGDELLFEPGKFHARRVDLRLCQNASPLLSIVLVEELVVDTLQLAARKDPQQFPADTERFSISRLAS